MHRRQYVLTSVDVNAPHIHSMDFFPAYVSQGKDGIGQLHPNSMLYHQVLGAHSGETLALGVSLCHKTHSKKPEGLSCSKSGTHTKGEGLLGVGQDRWEVHDTTEP